MMSHLTNAKRIFQKKVRPQRGFTLIFAVLVSTLILAVSISIMTIALKQVLFSGVGRESQFAYYAADTGIECALFWDFRGPQATSNGVDVFATSSESSIAGIASSEVLCGEGSIVSANNEAGGYTFEDGRALGYVGNSYEWDVVADIDSATTTFTLVLKQDDAYYCAEVRVGKWIDRGDADDLLDDRPRTIIDSRGYNTCEKATDRRYERGLRARY